MEQGQVSHLHHASEAMGRAFWRQHEIAVFRQFTDGSVGLLLWHVTLLPALAHSLLWRTYCDD